MKLLLILLSLSSAVMSAEIQTLSGAEAYQMYLKLPGKACQEYRLNDYLVLSKYQTNDCSQNQNDNSLWNCTVQLQTKKGKTINVISADCSREVN